MGYAILHKFLAIPISCSFGAEVFYLYFSAIKLNLQLVKLRI